MADARFPKPRHLRRPAEFDRVYAQRCTARNTQMLVFAALSEQGPRIGLSVGRKHGGSVVRSRIRRLLREAFRLAPRLRFCARSAGRQRTDRGRTAGQPAPTGARCRPPGPQKRTGRDPGNPQAEKTWEVPLMAGYFFGLPAWAWLRQIPASLLIGLVRVYQFTLSPLIGRSCRFEPSCSHYFIACVQQDGAWRGLWRQCSSPWRPVGRPPSTCSRARVWERPTDP